MEKIFYRRAALAAALTIAVVLGSVPLVHANREEISGSWHKLLLPRLGPAPLKSFLKDPSPRFPNRKLVNRIDWFLPETLTVLRPTTRHQCLPDGATLLLVSVCDPQHLVRAPPTASIHL